MLTGTLLQSASLIGDDNQRLKSNRSVSDGHILVQYLGEHKVKRASPHSSKKLRRRSSHTSHYYCTRMSSCEQRVGRRYHGDRYRSARISSLHPVSSRGPRWADTRAMRDVRTVDVTARPNRAHHSVTIPVSTHPELLCSFQKKKKDDTLSLVFSGLLGHHRLVFPSAPAYNSFFFLKFRRLDKDYTHYSGVFQVFFFFFVETSEI